MHRHIWPLLKLLWKPKTLPDCKPIGDKQWLMETLAARGDLGSVGVAVGDWSVISTLVSFMRTRIIK